jgi:hypothetical protein
MLTRPLLLSAILWRFFFGEEMAAGGREDSDGLSARAQHQNSAV